MRARWQKPTVSAVIPPRRYIQPGEWQSLRVVITKLHRAKKTLGEIQRMMAEHYRFFASVSSYKARFKAWGLRSYLNKKQRRYIIKECSERETIPTFKFKDTNEKLPPEIAERLWNDRDRREPKATTNQPMTPGGIMIGTPSPDSKTERNTREPTAKSPRPPVALPQLQPHVPSGKREHLEAKSNRISQRAVQEHPKNDLSLVPIAESGTFPLEMLQGQDTPPKKPENNATSLSTPLAGPGLENLGTNAIMSWPSDSEVNSLLLRLLDRLKIKLPMGHLEASYAGENQSSQLQITPVETVCSRAQAWVDGSLQRYELEMLEPMTLDSVEPFMSSSAVTAISNNIRQIFREGLSAGMSESAIEDEVLRLETVTPQIAPKGNPKSVDRPTRKPPGLLERSAGSGEQIMNNISGDPRKPKTRNPVLRSEEFQPASQPHDQQEISTFIFEQLAESIRRYPDFELAAQSDPMLVITHLRKVTPRHAKEGDKRAGIEKFIDTYIHHYGVDSCIIRQSYIALGQVLRMEGKYDDSLEALRNALNGRDHLDYTNMDFTTELNIWSIAETYRHRNEFSNALPLIQLLNARSTTVYGEHDARTTHYRFHLASVNLKLQNYNSALQVLVNLSKVEMLYHERDDTTCLRTQSYTADCLRGLGRLKEASELAHTVHDMFVNRKSKCEEQMTAFDFQFALHIHIMGHIRRKMSDLRGALYEYERAFSMLSCLDLDLGDPRTNRVIDSIIDTTVERGPVLYLQPVLEYLVQRFPERRTTLSPFAINVVGSIQYGGWIWFEYDRLIEF